MGEAGAAHLVELRGVRKSFGANLVPDAVEVPVLHVFLFIGALFVAVNYGLSRLSRRLEAGQ